MSTVVLPTQTDKYNVLFRFLFWSDWADGAILADEFGEQFVAKIERALLDGTDRVALVNQSIHWPNGITIDSTWLYWCDAFYDVLERINIDGTQRKVHILIFYNTLLCETYQHPLLET